jgi:hypothetical protein
MSIARVLAAPLCALLALSGCDGSRASRTGAEPSTAASAPRFDPAVPDSRREQRVQAMQRMHERMVAAHTPAERAALMDEHLVALQDGIALIEGSDPPNLSTQLIRVAEVTTTTELREQLTLMQLVLQLMLDRLPPPPPRT